VVVPVKQHVSKRSYKDRPVLYYGQLLNRWPAGPKRGALIAPLFYAVDKIIVCVFCFFDFAASDRFYLPDLAGSIVHQLYEAIVK
jgi:hypothetical protein